MAERMSRYWNRDSTDDDGDDEIQIIGFTVQRRFIMKLITFKIQDGEKLLRAIQYNY